MTVQCCKCKRIREENRWSLPLPALLQGDTSHTYCPICQDECYIELFSAQASKVTAFQALHLNECLARIAVTA